MDRRASAAFLFLLLNSVPMCTAFRIPASFGKFGRVPSVPMGDDELSAVINLQYHAQHQHLMRPMRESGATDGSSDDKKDHACRGVNGGELAHCQRLRFERFLAEDYKDAQANQNVVLAPPLPA